MKQHNTAPEADELSAAAAALGRKGGSVKGGRKAEASRENGKKGGWPPNVMDGDRRRAAVKAKGFWHGMKHDPELTADEEKTL